MDSGRGDAARKHPGAAPTGVRAWLILVWAAVLAMVLVGGITRLTESGLSMVEWAPLMGALPPTSDAQWVALFERYKAFPQYQQVNHWMALADFKRIFFWEYLHRLMGRLLGLLVLLPWMLFMVRRQLSPRVARDTLIAVVLGGLQGVLGWYMVMSGLADEPRVSHFRLAAHLLLAFAIGQWILWIALDASNARDPARRGSALSRRLTLSFIALLALQSLYGAFMAGTRAGYHYGTFPDMVGHYGPGPFFTGPSMLADALNSPSAIHYLHRALGWLTLACGFFVFAYIRNQDSRPDVRRAAWLLLGLLLIQFNLGAATVISRVAIPWAVAHQGMAYVLLSASVLLLHRLMGSSRFGRV